MIPLGDTPRKKNSSFITPCLIGINVIVFIFMLISFPDITLFFKQFGLIPSLIMKTLQTSFTFQPVYWTFISAMFIHGSWWHLISNMLFLWIFGDNVEDRMGKFLFLLFYLFVGLGASAIQIILLPKSDVPMVGASGAISGVMGAYIVLFPKASVKTLIPVLFFPLILNIPAIIFMVIWFVTQIINIAMGTSGVGWGAHLGGFLVGLLLGWIFVPVNRPTSAKRVDETYHFK